MDKNDESLAEHLNELEIRCAIGNFESFDPCMDVASRQSHRSFKLFKALELTYNSIVLHNYDNILQMDLSDFGLRRLPTHHIMKELPCVFLIDADDHLSLYVQQLILLFVGVSALQVFVRLNACGPGVSGSEENFPLCTSILQDLPPGEVAAFLSINGEFAADNLTQTRLLYLSHLFLSKAVATPGGSLTCGWWRIRYLVIHQRLLPDRIAQLHDEAVALLSKTVEMEWMNGGQHSMAELAFYVEAAHMHLHYHEVSLARKFISSAQNVVGLGIELSGAYGKRTQFQQKPTSQLFVKLRRSPGIIKGSLSVDNCSVPTDLHLQDDTLLNKVLFLDSEENRVDNLLPEEQIVLLGYCCLVKRSGAFDILLQDEVMSYVNCLLEQPKIWPIYLKALILRCKAEKDSSRRVERAVMQLESVIEAIKGEEPPFSKRAPVLYAVAFPMIRTLEKELADMWLSIGATKTALALYEKLQLWQDIVPCYQRLGRTTQAEAVIQKQLALQETPLLWCLLGDIRDDQEMYVKADELSKGTNARSKRSLGYYYYRRKEYAKCIPHFTLSLRINHLQSGVWFSLGYAAIQCEDYPLAAKAYRQVVLLDPDNFEAWNNLSNAYIRTQQKERAWRSLQEALKCNYEEWRVWENFLLVSVDVGAFEDALRAWHRLLDIQGKYTDSQVLGILVRAINGGLLDLNGLPASRLRQRALQLLGRLSSMIPNDYFIWESYSALQCPDVESEDDKEMLERAMLYQQKAVRFCSERWQCDFKAYLRVLEVTLKFVKLSAALVRLLEGDSQRIRQKSSTKLTVQTVITRIKNTLENFVDLEKQELESTLCLLATALCEFQDL